MFYEFLPLISLAGAVAAEQEAPSVDDIARANAATWSSFYAVDIQYEMCARLVEDGEVKFERSADGLRWSAERDIERLTLRDVDGRGGVEDYFLDGRTAKLLTYPVSTDVTKITLCDRKGARGREGPYVAKMLVEKAPLTLQYVTLLSEGSPMTLAELARKWKLSVEGRMVRDDDTLWAIRAVYRPAGEGDDRAGSQMDLLVNSAKGFLIQRVDVLDTAMARPVGGRGFVAVRYSTEVTAYADCGNGSYFPQVVECRNSGPVDKAKPLDGYFVTYRSKSLRINAPIEMDVLDFRFPANLPVELSSTGGAQRAKYRLFESQVGTPVYFESSKEVDDYIAKRCGPPPRASSRPHSNSWTFRVLSLAVAFFFLGVLWLIRRRR